MKPLKEVILKKDLYVYEKAMTELKLFNSSEFGEMRTCCDPKSGEVWFCLVDVCKALDLSNPRKVAGDLSDDVTISYPILDSLGRTQNATFVNESGLYRTIFKSRKEKALEFQDWVCSEVLPTIRRTGMYATSDLLDNPDLAIEIFQQLKLEREEKKKLQATINANKPKVDYADAILEAEGSILIKEMALWLQKNGIKIGQLKLYEWMRENGYTYKEGEMRNLPQQKWIEKGYFTLKKSKYIKENNVMTSTTAKITEKGQQYFIEKFRSQTA